MWNPNDIIDNTYTIVKELGHGGTGVIYLAYHMRLQKYVVLKKMRGDVSNIINVRNEVDILKNLHHTFLPQVYDFVQYSDDIYTVIDYIEGYDLSEYIKQEYKFTQDQLATWLLELCDVLSYLHNNEIKIIHCDIKPANIMITSQGDVCLIDFNISLNEKAGSDISGLSQNYASPEQYEKAMSVLYNKPSNAVIDERTDIYSLGATFYRLICGILPTADGSNLPLASMNLPYDEAFLRIIDKMMEKSPKNRFRNADRVSIAVKKLYQKSSKQKKIIFELAIASTCYLICAIFGIYMCYYGVQLRSTEEFGTAYNDFIQCHDNFKVDETIDSGLKILNTTEFDGILDKLSDKKAEVFYVIADSYFLKNEFLKSCEYYEYAYENFSDLPQKVLCCRDYAVALIRCGKLTEAQKLIDSCSDLKNDNLLLIRAEISNQKKEYKESLETLDEIFESCNDDDIEEKAYLLAADVYEKLNEPQKAIEKMNRAVQLNQSTIYLRKLAHMSLKYANTLGENYSAEFRRLNRLACDCYEKIISQKSYESEDIYSCALAYLQLGFYDNAKKLLQGVQSDFYDDWRLYMYLAFTYEGLGENLETIQNAKRSVELFEKQDSDDIAANQSDLKRLYDLAKEN